MLGFFPGADKSFASWLLVFFVALFWAGAFLGDLVGIGGYDGIAPEALYEEFQFGDVPSWLYQLTEIGTLAVDRVFRQRVVDRRDDVFPRRAPFTQDVRGRETHVAAPAPLAFGNR